MGLRLLLACASFAWVRGCLGAWVPGCLGACASFPSLPSQAPPVLAPPLPLPTAAIQLHCLLLPLCLYADMRLCGYAEMRIHRFRDAGRERETSVSDLV